MHVVPVACVVDVHVAVGLVDVDVAVGLVEVEVAVVLVDVDVVVDVVVVRLVESGMKGSHRWSSGRGESGVFCFLSDGVPFLFGRLAAG